MKACHGGDGRIRIWKMATHHLVKVVFSPKWKKAAVSSPYIQVEPQSPEPSESKK